MAKAAIGQICSSNSMAANLAQCVKLVGQAASAGAKILFLPEASDYIGTSAQESLSLARPVATSPFVTGLQAAAAQHSIAVHVGIHVPVAVKSAGPGSTASNPVLASIAQSEEAASSTNTPSTTKLYNRTIYIAPTGALVPSASYDKLHLFDYATLRESASTQAGTRLIPPIASPIGRLGSLICFDLRFPEPALHLTRPHPPHTAAATAADGSSSGPAQILLYPSAFTVPTGRAHWDVLLRSRAIETQSYVVAAAQVGPHNVDTSPSSSSSSSSAGAAAKKPRVSYGHSMVVDPWGRVILEMKGVRPEWDGERSEDAVEEGAVGELGIVDIDLAEWERVREKMPLIRRTDVYPEI
ncbi:carbon-nitrogen hydrolase [Hypoxylon argillaceum]|nr:carbon-nitrogen hydrolase [Hypoxylon argillaceum]